MIKKFNESKAKVFTFIKHPLFSGSFIMIVGTNFANFLAYLYHLVLGRMLGPSSYGELAATLAALGLLSTVFSFMGLVIVKFVSSANESERSKLFTWFFKKSLWLGSIMLVVFMLLAPFISKFLHIDIKIAILIGPILSLSLFGFLFRSFLQGLLSFGKIVFLTNMEVLFRLLIGIGFVYFNFLAFGGILGVFFGALIVVIFGSSYLKSFYTNKNNSFQGGRNILRYAIPVLIISITGNSLISSDLILVKHFFNSHDAGIYASLSNLGKIIFFGTSPISAVMFPIVAQKHSKKENYFKILALSLLLVGVVAGAILVIYFFFPKLMINILYGNKFLEGSKNLIWFGIFITLYTITSLIISFYLSIDKTKVVILPLIFAVFQVIGIYMFHNTILEVVKISILATSLLLLSLFIYFVYGIKKLEAKIK